MVTFVEYLRLILPGLTAMAVWLALLPRKAAEARILVLLILGMILRDGLAATGLVRIRMTEGLPWLRLVSDAPALYALAGSAVLLGVAIWLAATDLRDLITWWGERYGDRPTGSHLATGMLMGLAGAGTILVPFIAMRAHIPLDQRGGPVATGVIVPVMVAVLAVTAFAEFLVRGYVQGLFDEQVGANRALFISTAASAGLTTSLLLTSGVGWTLLAFAAWHGCVAAIVRRFSGVLPAMVTGGVSLAVLASGLL